MTAHEGAVLSISVPSLGAIFATGGVDGLVKVWDSASGEELHTFSDHRQPVQHIEFNPDGDLLLSFGADRTITVSQVASGETLYKLEIPDAQAWVRFTPGGEQIVGVRVGQRIIRAWDLHTGSLTLEQNVPGSNILSLAFNLTQPQIATGLQDGTVRIMDLVDGATLHKLGGHFRPVTALAFHPSGSQLLSGGEDGSVRVWKLLDSTTKQVHFAHMAPVTHTGYIKGGAYFYTVGNDGALRIWESTNSA